MDAIVLVGRPVTKASLHYTKHGLQQHETIIIKINHVYLSSKLLTLFHKYVPQQ